eukprot:gene47336-63443_t
MVGGFGSIDGELSVMFIGQQKGRNTKDRQYRNFGMPNPEGYRKALRLMKMAEKFNKPIVCLIDTPGAFPGLEAEERGEGASGGALGIAVGDRVLMMENTWYSVISPESCSSILWRSWNYKEQAAEALKLTANDMLANKLIDGIIPEPLGGAHLAPEEAAATLKAVIKKELAILSALDPATRITQRIDKFGLTYEAFAAHSSLSAVEIEKKILENQLWVPYESGLQSDEEFRAFLCEHLSLNCTDLEFDEAFSALLLDFHQGVYDW